MQIWTRRDHPVRVIGWILDRRNVFRADIHSRKRMTASHRDLKIKTFLS